MIFYKFKCRNLATTCNCKEVERWQPTERIFIFYCSDKNLLLSCNRESISVVRACSESDQRVSDGRRRCRTDDVLTIRHWLPLSLSPLPPPPLPLIDLNTEPNFVIVEKGICSTDSAMLLNQSKHCNVENWTSIWSTLSLIPPIKSAQPRCWQDQEFHSVFRCQIRKDKTTNTLATSKTLQKYCWDWLRHSFQVPRII